MRCSLRSSLGPRTEHALGHLHEPGEGSRARRRDAQRPQLPRRIPAKTDRTSSWQFGRLPGALRAPGSLSDRGEPRVEVEQHAGPSAVRGPERLRANPALGGTRARPARDPGLRQTGPLLAVHPARAVNGLASRPPESRGRQQGGRHPRRVGDGRIESAGVGARYSHQAAPCAAGSLAATTRTSAPA